MEIDFSELMNTNMDTSVHSMIRCKNYKISMLFRVLPEGLFVFHVTL